MNGLFAVEGWVFSVGAASVALVGPLGMALSDWLPGGDDDPDGGDPTGGDTANDGFGGFDGFDDFDDFDDELDDFDDAAGDDFDELDAGADPGAELESRIDELENEVESISSTVSTVRSENEEIGETVGEIEDNVRKLLEIYEMVTRGVNPFVDDVQPGFESGSFGLFEGAADADGGDEEEIDDDIVEADAESFFDDDFDDEGGGELFSEGAAGFGDGVADDADDADATDGDDGGATTFEDLKAEYESDGVDWDDAEPAGDDHTDGETVDGGPFDAAPEEDAREGEATFDELGEEPLAGDGLDRVVGDGGDGAGFEFVADADDDGGDEETPSPTNGSGSRKPYLGELPDGYASELVVMEWMEYLLGHADTPAALRAIRYYERLGWIDSAVADHLRRALSGFPRSNGNGTRTEPNGSGLSGLTVEHHTNSLEYISQLDPDAIDAAAVRSWPAGGR